MQKMIFGFALAFTSPVMAQTSPALGDLVDRLNATIENEQAGTSASETQFATELSFPDWGVLVRDQDGSPIGLFGQVPYEVTAAGTIDVPGYDLPAGASLELLPSSELVAFAAAEDLDPKVQPLTILPDIVGTATNFLAQELCGTLARPTSITLSLVVGASGGVWFATASAETGSEVSWEFRDDVCPRHGLEGENIPYR